MRVLLSAIACHPEQGSEGGVGWKAANALARKHQVHVLTSLANKADIVSHFNGDLPVNPTFTFFGVDEPYHENRLLARGQSWLRYLCWMKEVLPQAKTLVASRAFDVIQHVTFSTVRVASPLWQLGIPFVFGPSGGGERTPLITLPAMSPAQRHYETLRNAANALLPLNNRIRQTIRHSSTLLASNQPTAALFRKLGANPSAIIHLPVVFFSDEQMTELAARPKHWSTPEKPLRLFSSGMLEGRKGLSIALHAVAKARNRGIDIEFTVPSRGPEFAHLKNLAKRLGLSGVVRFPDSLPREEFWNTLMNSDIYMMPSLRDNCPATLLEAMLCRCVPFVVNCNGPGEMVPRNAGIKVEPAEPDSMAEFFAVELVRLARNRDALQQLAEAAAAHVRATFTESRYVDTVTTAYNHAAGYKI